ncbi:hypothetical protein LNP74_22950 [Klebsiella pneumoniae subsp. pneumoniae]|nr:hypothetical protein [Klebsiella pneumoniae subsp. pneumoniae]
MPKELSNKLLVTGPRSGELRIAIKDQQRCLVLWLNVPARVENDWFNELFRYLNAFDNLNEAITTLSLPANTKTAVVS